jgi:hypothetical protein
MTGTNKRVLVVDDQRQRDADFSAMLAKTMQRAGKTELNTALLDLVEYVDLVDHRMLKALFPPAHGSVIVHGSYPSVSPYVTHDEERLKSQQAKCLLPRSVVLAQAELIAALTSVCEPTQTFTLRGHAEKLYGDKCWQTRKHNRGDVKIKFKLPRKLKKNLKDTVSFLNQPGWNTVGGDDAF